MNVKLTKASRENISVMENLMQFYIYDFSEFVELDVKEDGLFEPYASLQEYWDKENERFPYFIKVGERYLGFVLVKYITLSDRNYFSMAEFFIMKKYRRKGIGRSIAEQVFNMHKGQWQIYQKESNRPAQVFWRKIITDYTKGQFKERIEHGKRIQEFEI
jgi:predicted acetyltransferase